MLEAGGIKSLLPWECLRIPHEELESFTGERDFWVSIWISCPKVQMQ